MPPLQELIHKLEEGAGKKYILSAFGLLAAVALVFVYDFREFKNMGNVEAMDAAQLARNLAEGKGYSTDHIRPFSMWLLKQKETDGGTQAPGPDVYRLRQPHPDLANPPVYPLLLAGWMKIVPMRFEIDTGKNFNIYQPDLMVAFLNQLLFLVGGVLVYLIGRRVFDPAVGAVSAVLFLTAELFWRFTVSGLPTLLLVDIFLGLVWVLVRVEEGVRMEQKGPGWVLSMTAVAGLLLALGTLTRYSFGWLIIPVAAYLLLFLGPQRILAAVIAMLVFVAAVSPWVVRNYRLSGTLFGIPGFAYMAGAGPSSQKVEWSLDPAIELRKVNYRNVQNKLTGNLGPILRDEIPRLGGTWLTGLFLAGLLIPFRSPALGRLRVLLLLSLAVLLVVQALGKTHLSQDSPELNTDNVLVLAAPLVFIFGVGMFFTLLGQMRFGFPQMRTLAIAAFVVVMAAPLLVILAPPRTYPHAYPPYYPPIVQNVSGYMDSNELMMSDIPAAVAWYGRRRCVGFTQDLENHFFEINDIHRPILGLYLSPATLDGKFLTQILGDEARTWGLLLMDSLIRREVPTKFPLRVSLPGYFPDKLSPHLFLTDRDRWTGKKR